MSLNIIEAGILWGIGMFLWGLVGSFIYLFFCASKPKWLKVVSYCFLVLGFITLIGSSILYKVST